MRPTFPAVLLILSALAVPAADSEAVPLYTNADLTRFATATLEPGSEVRQDPASWEFVREFIDREHARIDSARRFELERRRVEIEAERPVGYGLPYLSPLNYRYGYGQRRAAGCGIDPGRASQLTRPSLPLPAPIPIHAR